MAKPGPKPKFSQSDFRWSPDLAYAVGLLATDGCLSSDGRHIEITSKDIEQLQNFKKCLNLNNKISYKSSGYSDKKYPRIQFGSVGLYGFLEEVGLTPSKTKTLGSLKIPDEYFFDFLRGHHDGDGSFYSYWDTRWESSFMYYLTFMSASEEHIKWLQNKMRKMLLVRGSVDIRKDRSWIQLRYAKKESLALLKRMYYSNDVTCLTRKRLKIEKALSIVGESV